MQATVSTVRLRLREAGRLAKSSEQCARTSRTPRTTIRSVLLYSPAIDQRRSKLETTPLNTERTTERRVRSSLYRTRSPGRLAPGSVSLPTDGAPLAKDMQLTRPSRRVARATTQKDITKPLMYSQPHMKDAQLQRTTHDMVEQARNRRVRVGPDTQMTYHVTPHYPRGLGRLSDRT